MGVWEGGQELQELLDNDDDDDGDDDDEDGDDDNDDDVGGDDDDDDDQTTRAPGEGRIFFTKTMAAEARPLRPRARRPRPGRD